MSLQMAGMPCDRNDRVRVRKTPCGSKVQRSAIVKRIVLT